MKKQKLTRIGEIHNRHLSDPSEMIQFSTLFDEDNFIHEMGEDHYELVDFYCKNKDCDCTDTTFVIMLNGQETDERLLYDYEKRQLNEPSKYAFLLEEAKDIDAFNEALKYKHDIVKTEFEIFRLKNKEREIKEEIEEIEQIKTDYYEEFPSQKTVRNDDKIGRNDPCPCGSGKKYKRCCLKS